MKARKAQRDIALLARLRSDTLSDSPTRPNWRDASCFGTLREASSQHAEPCSGKKVPSLSSILASMTSNVCPSCILPYIRNWTHSTTSLTCEIRALGCHLATMHRSDSSASSNFEIKQDPNWRTIVRIVIWDRRFENSPPFSLDQSLRNPHFSPVFRRRWLPNRRIRVEAGRAGPALHATQLANGASTNTREFGPRFGPSG